MQVLKTSHFICSGLFWFCFSIQAYTHLEFVLIHDSTMGGLNSQLLYFKSGKRNLQESYSMSKVQSL
jgi:hypothetical protein